MSARIRPAAARLLRDPRGASLTELALAAPVLALFVTGIIDLGQGLSERFALQQAVGRSLELLQAGPLDGGADSRDVDYSHVAAEAAEAAGVPPSSVRLTRWRECGNVRQEDYFGNCGSGQETARYVQLRIEKRFQGRFFLKDRPMEATGAVRVQ